MLCVSLPGLRNYRMSMMIITSSTASPSRRYDFDGSIDCGKGKRNYMATSTTRNAAVKKMRLSISPLASSATLESSNSSRADFYKEVLESSRNKFTREISFQSKDKDISLAKALLYVAAEDEAFLAFNREMDARSIHNERRDTSSPSVKWDSVESMPMAGKTINEWLSELDNIANEVKAELVPREIGCDLIEVLDAVNKVLFEYRGFTRLPVVDSKCSYLHSALSSGGASAILLSVIYIEVCRRLNLMIVGSRVGEDFLIWPPTGNPEELFKVISGRSLFGVVNGKCVDDPRSRASDVNSNTLLGLDVATNRDIIGIALANLIRLYWKRASRTNYGLMLTSPLRFVHNSDEKLNKKSGSGMPLLRPQELRFEIVICKNCRNLQIPTHNFSIYNLNLPIRARKFIPTMCFIIGALIFKSTIGTQPFIWCFQGLAIMASERLLILQPHDWALRRDYGMMLYFNREYEAAVQELSICMAFAPEEEAEVLEPFIEKLHLMRLEASWKKALGQKGHLTVP